MGEATGLIFSGKALVEEGKKMVTDSNVAQQEGDTYGFLHDFDAKIVHMLENDQLDIYEASQFENLDRGNFYVFNPEFKPDNADIAANPGAAALCQFVLVAIPQIQSAR